MFKNLQRLLCAALVALLCAAALSCGAAEPESDAGGTAQFTQVHRKITVEGEMSGNEAIVVKATSGSKKTATSVTFSNARGADGEKVAITRIGDGENGVFDSLRGRRITEVNVTSEADSVALSTNAFKGSRVYRLKVTAARLVIDANAFKGSRVKNPTIVIGGKKGRKASSIRVSEGAFNGLGKRARIVVKRRTMTRRQFRKLRKALKAAGFPGRIVRG